MKEELIPEVKKNLKIKKFRKRSIIKEEKLLHLSSIIIPLIRLKNKKYVYLQKRPLSKTYGGKKDIFGGLVNKNKFTLKYAKKPNKKLLNKIFLKNTIKEANEEIKIYNKKTKQSRKIKKKDLIKIKKYQRVKDNEINEISKAYIIYLKKNEYIKTYDEIIKNNQIINIKTKSKKYKLKKIKKKIKNHPQKYGSGILRIIKRI